MKTSDSGLKHCKFSIKSLTFTLQNIKCLKKKLFVLMPIRHAIRLFRGDDD